jgi:2-polyprenyl-3-methyl-5-hydroxy-6-metoxy-1,4-benzoquinol methylase
MTIRTEVESELNFVEGLFKDYITSDNSPFLRYQRNVDIEKALEFMKPDGVAMELGCEVGYMSSLISPNVKTLDIIEGSASFIQEASKRNLSNATFHNMLFEQVDKENHYDYIFASHVLEHLQDPHETLKIMYKALKPGGRIFIFVPNATAASRQLAVKMGLYKNIYEMTPNDVRGGHRRVYDIPSISDEVKNAGFDLAAVEGLFFKPFADFQIDDLIKQEFLTKLHLDSLIELGKDYPELCGYIFVCGQK